MSVCRQSVTLRSLLENPELLAEPVRTASGKVKDVDDTNDYVASQLAFLGPNIWERTLPSSLVDLNIEGFGDLDTNVDFSSFLDVDLPNCCPQVDIEAMLAGAELPAALPPDKMAVIDSSLLQGTNPGVKQNLPSTAAGPRRRNLSKACSPVLKVTASEMFPNSVNTPSTVSFTPSTCCFTTTDDSFTPANDSFTPSTVSFTPSTVSFTPSTVSFTPPPDELSQTSQMSQFSGSGDDTFDPSKRAFSDEELRLLPVLKKSRKIFVPDDLKDDKYWARRIKNNTAAKRSREARRLKENQITMRTAFLEKENAFLKTELERTLAENESLKSRVEKYEAVCQRIC